MKYLNGRRQLRKLAAVCFWCDGPLIHGAGQVHPMAPSIEHFIPAGYGGSNSVANIVISHVVCNANRGSRLPTKSEMRKYLEEKGPAGRKNLEETSARLRQFAFSVKAILEA